MIDAWRIVQASLADEAYTGEGARLNGGRWNSRGHPVVYAASTISLATLEILVNIPRKELVAEFAVVGCWFPEAVMETLDLSLLPPDWADHPAPPRLQQIGNEWLESRASVVLAVPSAVTRTEVNYLLNPEHPDFASVDIGEPQPFKLDRRLFT